MCDHFNFEEKWQIELFQITFYNICHELYKDFYPYLMQKTRCFGVVDKILHYAYRIPDNTIIGNLGDLEDYFFREGKNRKRPPVNKKRKSSNR
jgi:hypothetical protein